jgi:hypothetical protein
MVAWPPWPPERSQWLVVQYEPPARGSSLSSKRGDDDDGDPAAATTTTTAANRHKTIEPPNEGRPPLPHPMLSWHNDHLLTPARAVQAHVMASYDVVVVEFVFFDSL